MAAWRAIEGKWNHDLCPWGPTEPGGKFNIQASFNGAYVALGVLYSGGDYYRAIEITTRAGQDTDSNSANTGGIMGTLVGYEGLPERVRREMWPYLNRIYNHTRYSIVTAADEMRTAGHRQRGSQRRPGTGLRPAGAPAAVPPRPRRRTFRFPTWNRSTRSPPPMRV